MAKRKAKDKDDVNKGGAPIGNQNALGNEGGRPPYYATPEDLQSRVDEYFEFIKGDLKEEREVVNSKTGNTQIIQIWNREPEPATITGFALFLGFASRSSLEDYEDKVEFSYIVKKGRTKVENAYEKALHMQSPTGAIFALKNMGWKDRVETKVTNLNYNSTPMSKERVKSIADALEEEY